ncbi:phosphotransferase enzyme family protein [Kribbella alba]
MTKPCQWISDDYGLEVTYLTPVDHGADVAAAVWQAQATTGEGYAVKWSGAGTDAAPLTAAYLAGRGVRGVPAPLQTRTGDLWSKREGKRLSLVPWISGSRAAETGLTPDQWSSYGALLAEVHATAPSADLCEVLPRLSPISARMPAQLRSVEHRLTAEPPADALEDELATVWRERRGLVTDLLHLAEELASKKLGGDLAICHADPHLGNVLVSGGTGENNVGSAVEPTDWHLHLIDWDDVIFAPREQDLMFMLGGMGAVGPTTEAQLSAFLSCPAHGSQPSVSPAMARSTSTRTGSPTIAAPALSRMRSAGHSPRHCVRKNVGRTPRFFGRKE